MNGIREQKLHPKLRMIRNGDDAVNAVRAFQSPNVVSTLRKGVTPVSRIAAAAGVEPPAPPPAKPPRRRKLKGREAKHAFVGVFVELHRDREVGGPAVTAQDVEALKQDIGAMFARAPGAAGLDRCLLSKRNFIAATVPVADLDRIAADDRVAFVHPAEP